MLEPGPGLALTVVRAVLPSFHVICVRGSEALTRSTASGQPLPLLVKVTGGGVLTVILGEATVAVVAQVALLVSRQLTMAWGGIAVALYTGLLCPAFWLFTFHW